MPPPYTLERPEALDSTAHWSAEGYELAAWRRGDRSALDALVERHEHEGQMVARRYMNDESAANDIVQDAFIRVLRSIDSYDPSRPFRGWFVQIVKNLCLDELRRQRRQLTSDVIEESVTSFAGDRLERSELTDRVQIVLKDLPEKYRSILIARDQDEEPAEAIAERIKVNYQTTRWRLHYARGLFRKAWENRYGAAPN